MVANHLSLPTLRRVVPALLAGALLAPAAVVLDALPAAASTSGSSTRLLAVALTGSSTPTLRALVSASSPGTPTPTGTVTFAIEGSGPIQCDDLDTNTMPTTGGVATCKITSGLPPGTGSPATAVAIYSGDATYSASGGTFSSIDGSFTPGSPSGSSSGGGSSTGGGSDPGGGTGPTQTSGQMVPPPGYAQSQLIFDDQFGGRTLDTSKWTTSLGAEGIVWNNRGALPTPFTGPNVPGDGTESAMFAPSQVSVNDGLTLTAQRNANQYASAYPWISGVVTTEGKFSLPTSGWYVQVLAKMPDQSQGMWPAIWFLPGMSGSSVNEFDGYEGGWPGAVPNQVMHTDYFANQGQQQNAYSVPADVSAGYHVYGFRFLPGRSITAFFDGMQVWQVTASSGITITGEPYEIMLELQVASQQTAGWHTVTTDTTPSATIDVAEVQAYSSP